MPKGFPAATPGRVGQQIESLAENDTGLTIFDKTAPRSVYNLVPESMQVAIDNVNPKYFEWRLTTLEKHLRPDARLCQLRVAFWREYNYVQDNRKRNISYANVIRGICDTRFLTEKIFQDQLSMAYLLYPVVDQVAAMEEMAELSMREMRKILKLPNQGKKGANMPIIKEKIKIFEILQNRLQGAVIQNHRVHQVHQVVPGTPNSHLNTGDAERSVKDIQEEIAALEGMTGEKDVVEITPEEVTPQGSAVEDTMTKKNAEGTKDPHE